MAVFDDIFVDENICSGLAVGSDHRQRLHEFILGAHGVALNRALEEAVAEVEAHNRELREAADAIPAAALAGISVDDFCGLPNIPHVDGAIQDAERNFAAAREQQSIRLADRFDPFLLPSIDLGEVLALLAKSIEDVDPRAVMEVEDHIERIGEDGEAWVASGVARINAHNLESCPFCAQGLAGSTVFEHYRAYFSAAYEELKAYLAQARDEFARAHGTGASGDFDLAAAFERAIRLAVERRQFWSRFTDVPEILLDTAKVSRAWSAARALVLSVLQTKINMPLQPLGLGRGGAQTIAEYEQCRLEVEELSNRLQEANAAIAVVKEQAAAGNIAALQRDVARLQASRARHSAAIEPLCDDYLTARSSKVAAEQRRDAARAALTQYRQTIFPAYQVAINEYLRKFNAAFRVSEVTVQNTRAGSACTYSVLINNQQVPVSGSGFRASLSAGDRNTLALAFFFASLDQDQSLADKIVVIDDPVSSLDEHRSLTTVQELRRLMERVGQVIVLSHNKPFLCNVWEGTDDTLRAALEVVRDGDGSTIQGWDVNRDMITEHDRRHELLRNYVETASPNAREVAQALRPVLESFCRVAYPLHFPPGTMLGPFRGKCDQRVGTATEILN